MALSIMADIFISYAREDIATARAIAKELEARGWSVFWDRHIPHGHDFSDYLQKQIDSARCILVLWSKASVASKFVRDEAAEGLEGRLVPILVEQVKQPLGFRQLQAADLSAWAAHSAHEDFDRLVSSIQTIVMPSVAARSSDGVTPSENPTSDTPMAALPSEPELQSHDTRVSAPWSDGTPAATPAAHDSTVPQQEINGGRARKRPRKVLALLGAVLGSGLLLGWYWAGFSDRPADLPPATAIYISTSDEVKEHLRYSSAWGPESVVLDFQASTRHIIHADLCVKGVALVQGAEEQKIPRYTYWGRCQFVVDYTKNDRASCELVQRYVYSGDPYVNAHETLLMFVTPSECVK